MLSGRLAGTSISQSNDSATEIGEISMDPVVISETVAALVASGAGKGLGEGVGSGLVTRITAGIRKVFGRDRRSLESLEKATSDGSPQSIEELAAALHWYAQQDLEFARELAEWASQAGPEIRQQVKANRQSFAAGRDQTIFKLGGEGGNAPGASGGGGGVIGSGTGGPGGSVGRIELSGTQGEETGAGGGGAGAISPESSLLHQSRLLPTEGISDFLGIDGGTGGDSWFGPGDDGRILRARGGEEGLAGTGKRVRSDELSLSAMLFANSLDHRDGLAFMLGGAWESLSSLNFPADVRIVMLLVLEAGGVPAGEYTIKVQARDPFDEIAGDVQFGYGISKSGDILRKSLQISFALTIPEPGVWTFVALHEERELRRVPLYFKRGV
jgi:hypothetical protein